MDEGIMTAEQIQEKNSFIPKGLKLEWDVEAYLRSQLASSPNVTKRRTANSGLVNIVMSSR